MGQEHLIFDIYKKSCTDLSTFEIWAGYYKLRLEEFKKFNTLFPKSHFSNTLEIGCGIGYQAAFLSTMSDKVVASDVDFGEMIQHSRGLAVTRDFIEKSGIKNIKVVAANAEDLPFADEEFDFIYSSYAFQYIVNKDKALQEIKRVLKKDGYFFCVLPTTANRFKAAINYYKEIIKKIPLLFTNNKIGSINKIKIAGTTDKVIIPKKWYTKLLPPPDNFNNNVFNEYFLYSPTSWQTLFLKNQHKIILKKFSAFSPETKTVSFLKTIKLKLISDGLILLTKK